MNQLITIRIIIDHQPKKTSPAQLDALGRAAMLGAESTIAGWGIHAVGGDYLIAKPSREEAIGLTPRKKHHGVDGFTDCRDEPVAKRNTTEDWTKVTCKHCLRRRPAGRQREFFDAS